MREIELLVERYLAAERDLVAAVDAAGGAVSPPDGRTVTVGSAEFDARCQPGGAGGPGCSIEKIRQGRRGDERWPAVWPRPRGWRTDRPRSR